MDRNLWRAAAVTLAVDADTAEVVRALCSDGVEPVLLKGPAVGRVLHPGGELRPYGDIDLMVAPEALAQAEATLRELGYAPAPPPLPLEPPRHATTWRHPRRSPVDLHHRIHFVVAPPERIWEMIRHGAQAIDVADTPVLVPRLAVLAMHLALHAAVSAHDVPKTLTDLERAFATLPRAVWDDALALAAELDVVDAFAGGIALTPAGARLAEDLRVPTGGTTAMHLWNATTEQARPWTIERLVALPSVRARVAAIARCCFPPAARVRPVGGRPGHFWLLLGYCARLGRNALHLPRSVAAWARLTGHGPAR